MQFRSRKFELIGIRVGTAWFPRSWMPFKESVFTINPANFVAYLDVQLSSFANTCLLVEWRLNRIFDLVYTSRFLAESSIDLHVDIVQFKEIQICEMGVCAPETWSGEVGKRVG